MDWMNNTQYQQYKHSEKYILLKELLPLILINSQVLIHQLLNLFQILLLHKIIPLRKDLLLQPQKVRKGKAWNSQDSLKMLGTRIVEERYCKESRLRTSCCLKRINWMRSRGRYRAKKRTLTNQLIINLFKGRMMTFSERVRKPHLIWSIAGNRITWNRMPLHLCIPRLNMKIGFSIRTTKRKYNNDLTYTFSFFLC